MKNDTIVGISTPPGEGAIAIVRMSGDKSISIISDIFFNKNGKKFKKFEDKTIKYGHIVYKNEIIDEVLVSIMLAPNTYTKEDIVEINCHGGRIPIQRIISLLLKKGARMAEAGEFTKLAFLNGRLDLSQAESVMDMISAKTKDGFKVALNQLDGKLSEEIVNLRKKLLSILAEVQVNIDYPDEDIEEIIYEDLKVNIENIKYFLEQLLKNSEAGKIIREGLNTVIVGKPNVGKSSLLNALLKESRAIVTEIPGTTRDIIEEYINIKGIPVKIIDTAGIRDTEDVVEKIGVEKSKEFFNKADLIILVLNASEKLSNEDIEILNLTKNRESIILVNKTDLESKIEYDEIERICGSMKIIKISVANNFGIDEVENEIFNMVYNGKINKSEDILVTNSRHINSLEKSISSLNDAIDSIDNEMALDFVEVDLNNSYSYLGEIIGDSLEENIIDKIFSNFCLGK